MTSRLYGKQVWTVVALIGAYVLCQAIADVGATKIVQIGSVTMPGGTFIFALTFTLRDMVHKRLGKDWARAAIVVAGSLNILQAVYLSVVGGLDCPPFYDACGAWGSIFALVPAIAIGSIGAEIISEWIDTDVYHWWRHSHQTRNLPQWTAVIASNVVSLPLDSLIFGSLAFVLLPPLLGGHAMPFLAAMGVVGGQIMWKAIVTVVSLPLIYLIKEEAITG